MNNPQQVQVELGAPDGLPLNIDILTKNHPNGLGGVFGTSILYHIAGRISNSDDLTRVATQLLEVVADHISELGRTDFLSGLPGLGWGIEWLAQNNFIDVNTDEILEEIDDTLYKSVVFSQMEDISIRSGTLGLLMYFVKRFRSNNKAPNRMRKLAIQECIVILTDEMVEKTRLLGHIDGLVPSKHYIDIGNAVIFWAALSDLNINAPTVEEGLYHTVSLIKATAKKLANVHSVEYIAAEFIYMLSSLNVASRIFNHEPWRQHSRLMLDHFKSFVEPGDNTSLSVTNNFLLSREFPADYTPTSISLNVTNVSDLQFQALYYKNTLISYSSKIPSIEELIRII